MIKKYNKFINEELNVSQTIPTQLSSEEDKYISDLGYLLSDLSKKDYDFDFIDIDKDNSDSLTFLPSNRVKSTEDSYNSSNRISIKTGRLIKKVLDGLTEDIILEDVHIFVGYYREEIATIAIDNGYFENTWIPNYKYSFLKVSVSIEGENINESYTPQSIDRSGQNTRFIINETYGQYDDKVDMVGTLKIKIESSYNNKLLEDVTHIIKASRKIIKSGFKNMKIVEGEEIREWYNEKNYTKDQKSTLGKSCMKYEGTSKFLDIYCENSNIKLLIYLDDDGKLLARDLLWNLEDGRKYMDRCYYNDESLHYIFNRWAVENSYYYYSDHNIYHDGAYVDAETFRVKLDKSLFDFYPYMDTFKYLYANQNLLSTVRLNGPGCRRLDDTEGGWF